MDVRHAHLDLSRSRRRCPGALSSHRSLRPLRPHTYLSQQPDPEVLHDAQFAVRFLQRTCSLRSNVSQAPQSGISPILGFAHGRASHSVSVRLSCLCPWLECGFLPGWHRFSPTLCEDAWRPPQPSRESCRRQPHSSGRAGRPKQPPHCVIEHPVRQLQPGPSLVR